jgi:hypothetical protein
LEECALLLAGHSWLEGRLFIVTGSWATEVGDPPIKVWLAEVSRAHGRRAQAWRQLMPQTATIDPVALLDSADRRLGVLGDALAATEGVVERMAVLARVALARLAGAYALHLECSSELSDAAVMAQLRVSLADIRVEWAAAELIVERLVGSPELVETALQAQGRMEPAWVAIGYPRHPGVLTDDTLVAAGPP